MNAHKILSLSCLVFCLMLLIGCAALKDLAPQMDITIHALAFIGGFGGLVSFFWALTEFSD